MFQLFVVLALFAVSMANPAASPEPAAKPAVVAYSPYSAVYPSYAYAGYAAPVAAYGAYYYR